MRDRSLSVEKLEIKSEVTNKIQRVNEQLQRRFLIMSCAVVSSHTANTPVRGFATALNLSYTHFPILPENWTHDRSLCDDLQQ